MLCDVLESEGSDRNDQLTRTNHVFRGFFLTVSYRVYFIMGNTTDR